VASVTLTTRADDGIVVYVNGVEVLRKNISAGTVTSGTYASSAVSASTAVANPVTVSIPGSAFTTGTNVIAAEVHSNYRSTPSHSFELSAVSQ
jgi:formylglycine-generating enzyme required for sulfatase activity